jgi:hypothetical protein
MASIVAPTSSPVSQFRSRVGRAGPLTWDDGAQAGAAQGSVDDREDRVTEPEQPPSWSPEQPPPSGGGYAVPPGQSAPPPPPPPPTPPPAYGQAPPPPPGYGPPGYGPPGYGPPAYGQPSYGQPAYPPQYPPYGPPAYGPAYGQGLPAAPKPGIVPLRPLIFSEILDGAIKAIRSNPRMLKWSAVGTVGVLVVFGAVIGGAFAAESVNNNSQTTEVLAQGSTTIAQLVLELILIGGQTLLGGLLVVSVSESVLGHQATFGQTWARVRPSAWRLIGFTLLSSLAIGIASCCIIPGLILGAFWALGAPALVLEGIGVRAAFSRSWNLVSGSFWRVLGIIFVTQLLTQFITVVVAGVFAGVGALAGLVFGTTGAIIGAVTLGSIGLLGAITVSSTFGAAVKALLYVDQRMRREGLDIALARAAGVSS